MTNEPIIRYPDNKLVCPWYDVQLLISFNLHSNSKKVTFESLLPKGNQGSRKLRACPVHMASQWGGGVLRVNSEARCLLFAQIWILSRLNYRKILKYTCQLIGDEKQHNLMYK